MPPTATGRRGKAWPTKAPPAHITYRSTYCECCGFSYQGPQWGWDRTALAEVFACDVCGSAMRGPVVESHAGKAVEGPAAGKAVRERAAQSCELTRSSHKSDALYVVAEAEGEYEVKGLGRGTTSAVTGNRAANFDAATLDRFKARSERIIYEQTLGDAVGESRRGLALQQAANVHSQTPYFSTPPEVNGRVEIKLPLHRYSLVDFPTGERRKGEDRAPARTRALQAERRGHLFTRNNVRAGEQRRQGESAGPSEVSLDIANLPPHGAAQWRKVQRWPLRGRARAAEPRQTFVR